MLTRLILLFIFSFGLRIYKLGEQLFFGFEQGRDALIAQNIYQLKDFVLTGPSSSIGGVFHGPYYYYLLALTYFLSSGNPLGGALFISIIGSLVPILIFFVARDFFKSTGWAQIAAVICIISFEYILYSRWLSNVSPAIPFVVLAFWMLWKNIEEKKDKFLLGFVLFASIASQFQIMLSIQFIFVFLLLTITRVVKLPNFKILILMLFIALFIYGPLILFDFRNQHITFNALSGFLFNGGGQKAEGCSTCSGFLVFTKEYLYHIQRAVININLVWLQILFIVLILFGFFNQNIKEGKKLLFLVSWILAPLPIILISPGNPQYYLISGLGWVLVTVSAIKFFWESKRLRSASFFIIFMIAISFISSFYKIDANRDIFFVTTQDDLNLKDQTDILNFIHADAKGQPYKFDAFTIPSLHSEGWQYLHRYYFPEDTPGNAKIIYIAIEKAVYPVWEEKWINDNGRSQLIFEKKFGLLRLQKREFF